MLYKKITFLLLGVFISGCAQIDLKEYEKAHTIEKFNSTQEVLSFLNKRDEAIEKLNEYAPPYRFGRTKWYSRLLPSFLTRTDEEEIVVTGIRASEVARAPDLDIEESLSWTEGASITNNQELEVDEGGIVKRLGNYLIVLRKGKLYSILVADELNKVDEISLQPTTWQHEAWYDELLVHKNILLVVGYSYENESTEYVFFELDKAGNFHRQNAYLVGSGDYYSSSNYAGRMIGDRFVFYIEDLAYDSDVNENRYDKQMISPIASRVDQSGRVEESYPLFESHDVYSPVLTSRFLSFTTAITCPINIDAFRCNAKSILSGTVADFYVSKEAFYFWMRGTEWNRDYADIPTRELKRYAHSKHYEHWPRNKHSAIYRLPFNDEPVGLVKIKGYPIDQFSFKQSRDMLHIVGIEGGNGDEIWNDSSDTADDVFFTSIPLTKFKEGVVEWNESDFALIEQDKIYGLKNNRFVGNSLVYTNSNDEDMTTDIFVLDIFDSSIMSKMEVAMEVEQLHPIGNNMLLVGYDDQDSVQYQTLALEQDIYIADSLIELDNKLAESRSHGFFYKPDSEGGIFAIPTFIEHEEDEKKVNGTYYYAEDISDMLFTRVTNNLTLHPAGALEGTKKITWENSDDCELSCYDWYGSARPIFWDDRIFALLKYEVVEGVRSGDIIKETRRIDIRD